MYNILLESHHILIQCMVHSLYVKVGSKAVKKIKESSIQHLFPSQVYRRGLQYYKDGRVSDLLFDINHNVWTANVSGTTDYFVEINLTDLDKGTVRAHCECPAFATYNSCKHNVAVLLAISRHQHDPTIFTEHVDESNDQLTEQFINALTATQNYQLELDALSHKVPMHVEYYLKWSYERNFHLELKTGERRYYVVRDLVSFLDNVLSNNEHVFTHIFTYHPDDHYFLEQDLEIFNILYTVLKNEQIYRHQLLDYDHKSMNDRRSVTIPPLVLQDLLEKVIERDLTVEIDDIEYQHVDVVDNQLPFSFEITQTSPDDVKLKMPDVTHGTYFPTYEVLFQDGTFYFPKHDQIPILEQIDRLGIKQDELPISKKQAEVFLSEVLPTLEKIAHVQIDDDVTERMIKAPLQAKLYLEMKDHLVIGKLEYHYDEYVVNPFSGKGPDDVIIIRQSEKEQQIMSFIEQVNFRYNGKELYIEADEEELYDFLYTILPKLEKQVDLYLTADIRHLIVDYAVQPSTHVRVNESTQLLEIGFDIAGISDEEVHEVLQAVVEKKRYYRLNSGALLSLESEDFSSVEDIFSELNVHPTELNQGMIEVPAYRSAQVDELLDGKNYDPTFRKLLRQLESPEQHDYDLPEDLNAELRPYQQLGYQWFKSLSAYHLGGILADDMGLGKTVQSIAYILSEPSEHPHLVIAPSSVVYNWKSEFNRFAPNLKIAMMTGTPEERKQKINDLTDKDVWITSYAMARQDIALYRDILFQSMILDEAQYVKNYETKTSQAIRSIQATRRFALSGTPIENSIDELWSIFQVIMPGLMPSRFNFRKLSHDKIARLTRPFILRRLKRDVLTELPEKIESTYISELTKEQKELYVGYLRQLQEETTHSLQQQPFHQQRMKILAGLTRLRQICCHPSLFIDNYEGESGKLEQLIETVKTSIENGKRMLIFSQFTSMHEIIIDRLEKEGIDYFYLQGATPSEQRLDMSERFNSGEKDVFLISLRAGGTGLNLTGADTVILYDLWWNPAVEDQAAGRAHRFGQKNVVHVIRLISEGTIEEKIYDLQQQKRELIDRIVQPGETMLSSLTEEDIKQLLNIN